MDFLKKHFLDIILFFLVVALIIQRCTAPAPKPEVINSSKIEVKHDTVWLTRDSVVYSKPQLVKSEPVTRIVHDTVNIPGKPILINPRPETSLINYFTDTLHIPEGWIATNDTVANSLIIGRSFAYSLRHPEINNSVTIHDPVKPKLQLYFGGGIKGNQELLINQFELGFLLKNKKDQLFGINANLGQTGLSYGLSTYWKIRFK